MGLSVQLTPTYHSSAVSMQENLFNASIPVIDISQFGNVATRQSFLESLNNALKVGFFAVINPDINIHTIKAGYDIFKDFFASSYELKMGINKPELSGQRGYVPGETALGSNVLDGKEFVHIGRKGNIWPNHINLKEPAKNLFKELERLGQPLLQAISLLLGQSDNYLTDMTVEGQNLMRALHYFQNPKNDLWAAEHTDIDLLTILPYASEKGLEVNINGEWVMVVVPQNALIVNVGDMLEAFSNGQWPSCNHRVRSTTPDTERESIVFFIHPNDETMIKPLGNEAPRYPAGIRSNYLFLRLFSLGLLSEEMKPSVINGDFINKIKEMVKNGDAAESVRAWYQGYIKTLSK